MDSVRPCLFCRDPERLGPSGTRDPWRLRIFGEIAADCQGRIGIHRSPSVSCGGVRAQAYLIDFAQTKLGLEALGVPALLAGEGQAQTGRSLDVRGIVDIPQLGKKIVGSGAGRLYREDGRIIAMCLGNIQIVCLGNLPVVAVLQAQAPIVRLVDIQGHGLVF